VAGTPSRSSVSAMRHHAALVPYSKCDSMQRSARLQPRRLPRRPSR
jgi:hypothetical protein